MFAMTTPIPIHLDMPDPDIFHRFIHSPPTLKGFSFAIGTLLRSLFCLLLDSGQFQHHNCHGELLVDWLRQPLSYKKLVLFAKPTAAVIESCSGVCNIRGW